MLYRTTDLSDVLYSQIIAQERKRRKFAGPIMTEFKYLLYKTHELEKNGILPEDLGYLFGELRRHGITIIKITEKTLPEYMYLYNILPETTLTIAATDQTLTELAGLPAASVGYKTSVYPSEGLYQADILVEAFWEVDYYFLERVYQRKHNIPWRVIETKRCYLREMTLSDLPGLFCLYQDPDFSRYLEPLYSWNEEVEYTKAYIENMYRYYGFGMWLIKDRFTDELIGRAGFNLIKWQGKQLLEMGYAIACAYRKQGYATEVCQALIAYAKSGELAYSKLYCFVQKENLASRLFLEKLGFALCERCIRDGKEMLVYRHILIGN